MAGNIRPRKKPGAAKVRTVAARGFLHQIVKELKKASIAAGYVNRRGTPDYTRLADACDVSRRMLYYCGDGGNLSLRALDQWAEVVGCQLFARREKL